MGRKSWITSKVRDIYVRHTGPRTKMKGSYMSRKDPYVPARMTLWAITELEDHVWLDTQEGLGPGRVKSKVQDYQDKNMRLVGQTIEYTNRGFVRGFPKGFHPRR